MTETVAIAWDGGEPKPYLVERDARGRAWVTPASDPLPDSPKHRRLWLPMPAAEPTPAAPKAAAAAPSPAEIRAAFEGLGFVVGRKPLDGTRHTAFRDGLIVIVDLATGEARPQAKGFGGRALAFAEAVAALAPSAAPPAPPAPPAEPEPVRAETAAEAAFVRECVRLGFELNGGRHPVSGTYMATFRGETHVLLPPVRKVLARGFQEVRLHDLRPAPREIVTTGRNAARALFEQSDG